MKLHHLLLLFVGVAAIPAFAQPRQPVTLITGKAFDAAVPRDFYLEGNAIPTEKRNAAFLRLPSGGRALFALIDTTGYAQDIQTKYVGMFIIESSMGICGAVLQTGSYGFGWVRPKPGAEEGPGLISIYDQAGRSVGSCATSPEGKLEQPRPLQVLPGPGGTGRLYYGRQVVVFR